MIINIDMDGVLANFDKRKLELFNGYEPKDIKEAWKILSSDPTLYLNLEPLDDARDLVSGIYNSIFEHPIYKQTNLTVLTGIPRACSLPTAEEQKRKWIEIYFPTLSNRFKIGPFASDKYKHCFYSSDILIDDNEKNINEWNKAGGIGILHISAKETLKQLKDIL